MLLSMGSQRVGHDLVTQQQQEPGQTGMTEPYGDDRASSENLRAAEGCQQPKVDMSEWVVQAGRTQ